MVYVCLFPALILHGVLSFVLGELDAASESTSTWAVTESPYLTLKGRSVGSREKIRGLPMSQINQAWPECTRCKNERKNLLGFLLICNTY